MVKTFSLWMRRNLKDAFSGLITQDIDFVFVSKNKDFFFFLEEKNSMTARVGSAQKIIFKLFNDFNYNEKRFYGTYIFYAIKEKQTREELLDFIYRIKNKKLTRPNYEIDNNELSKLWDCTGTPPIKKTEKERSGYRGSVIKKVLTKDIIDEFLFIEPIHWIFVNYCSGNFIFLEELTKNSKLDDKRREFIDFIDQIFRQNNINSNARNPKSNVRYKYLGYYILKFENTNPDNSPKMYLNNKEISKQELIKVLNLDDDSITAYSIN